MSKGKRVLIINMANAEEIAEAERITRADVGLTFLNRLLADRHIPESEFYNLVSKLKGVPYLENTRVSVQENSWRMQIESEYTGDNEIGLVLKYRSCRSGTTDREKEHLERLYDDLSHKTGYIFHESSLEDTKGSCQATVLFGDVGTYILRYKEYQADVILLEQS